MIDLMKEIVNDIVGSIISFWGMYGLMQHPESWTFVAVVFFGLCVVFGRQIANKFPIPGLGGQNGK